MSIEISNGSSLTDAELLLEVRRLAGAERQATARLVAALSEVDVRRLYLGEGCSSLFTYCTQVLHLSEHAAYGRIEAARAARKWPAVLELLGDGTIHLTAVTLLAPHFTTENHRDLLAAARHKSKREVEAIVAALRPLPPVPSTVRKLPAPRPLNNVASNPTRLPALVPAASDAARADDTVAPRTEAEARMADVKPLSPEHYKLQFTISREAHDKLRQAQDLLRHRLPSGDIAAIFERALTLLLADLQRTRCAATDRPQSQGTRQSQVSRYIPAAVRREVWGRDDGRCAFVGTAGRCSERGLLEYHHVVPFADGGAATVDNLELRCRAHNAYEAERWFGVSDDDLVRERPPAYGAWTFAQCVATG